MSRKTVLWVSGAVVALALAGGAVAYATGNDSEGGATGPAARKAVQTALTSTGGGSANSVELDGQYGGKWDVEVAKPDGSVVDVFVNADYKVVGTERDDEGPKGSDSGN